MVEQLVELGKELDVDFLVNLILGYVGHAHGETDGAAFVLAL